MVYKLLFFLAFFTPGQMFYNLEDIQCPKWVPGTDELLPQEVRLFPERYACKELSLGLMQIFN